MDTTNHFELRAHMLTVEQANSSSDFYKSVGDELVPIDIQIWVDGHQLDEGIAVDFLALLDTTHKLEQSVWKPYWGPSIFACGCGAPGCAGMNDAIEVSHDDQHVVWHANLPLMMKQRSAEHPHGVETTFRFLKSQMVEECRNFVKTARSVSGGKLSLVRVPVHKESLDVLLRTSRHKWARKGETK